MRITQSWRRDATTTAFGESITMTIKFTSFDKAEIDQIAEKMPWNLLVMDTNEKEEERHEESV